MQYPVTTATRKKRYQIKTLVNFTILELLAFICNVLLNTSPGGKDNLKIFQRISLVGTLFIYKSFFESLYRAEYHKH